MKILIVDDHLVNRKLLIKLLEKTQHSILLAENGQEAVELFQQHQPDLILMDVLMPVMDGIEAINIIRNLKAEKWVHIIVISALSDEGSVVQGLKAGADDYISKPFNTIILNAKISVIQRMVSIQNTLLENKHQLQNYHYQNEIEQNFAKHIFEKLIAQNNLNDAQLEYWIKPSKKFCGDLISTQRIAPDQLYFMLADATGHGLAAALPTIIVNQVFQAMCLKKRSVSAIVREINSRLNHELPTGHFVALSVGLINTTKQSIECWNGGLPALSVINNANEITHSFPSKQIFCGVLNDEEFDNTTYTYHWSENSELFVHSDGLTDVINEQGNILGDEQLRNILLKTQAGKRIKKIKKEVIQYIDLNQEQDDISCLCILCE